MSFYTEVLMRSPVFKSSTICKDPAMLAPPMRAAILALLDDAKAAGYDLQIAETFRSQARQQMLYREGYTKLKNVGVHNAGLACDLNLFDGGKYVSDGRAYLFLRHFAEKHGLISGIDWGRPDLPHSFRDYDHVQLCAMDRQNALFAKAWFPPDDYNALLDSGRYVPTALNAPLIVPHEIAFAKPPAPDAKQVG